MYVVNVEFITRRAYDTRLGEEGAYFLYYIQKIEFDPQRKFNVTKIVYKSYRGSCKGAALSRIRGKHDVQRQELQ